MQSYRLEDIGARLFYQDLPGVGPPLVMLHGLGSASSLVFPRVASHPTLQGYRSILVDLLGFGYSERPTDYDYAMESQAKNVARLLDHLQLRNCTVVGHSMGGSIAILLADARPDLVGHLLVAEASLDPGPGLISSRIVCVPEEVFVSRKHAQFHEQMLAAGYCAFASTLRAADPQALYRSAVSLIAERNPSYREQFYRFTHHKTFIYGERTLPNPNEEELRAEGISVRVVPNASHDMVIDNPDGFSQTIADAIIATGDARQDVV